MKNSSQQGIIPPMNEPAATSPGPIAANKPAAPAGAPAKRRWLPPLWPWLLIMAAIGSSSYVWYQQKMRSAENAAQISELKRQLRALDENPVMIELKQRVLDQDSRLAGGLAEQQARINALQQAFEATRDVINRDQRGWILAEIEYLMRMAITRLQLTYDIQGATQALITADQRLNDLADPSVLQVRKVLSAEITALKSLQRPDIEGAALQLLSISNRLYQLPPAKQPATQRLTTDGGEERATGDSFWINTWARFKALIGLRKSDVPRTASAIQSELYYIEQLLRFELEAARQAALRLNKEEFDKRLINARTLLDNHYDRNHEQVIRMRAELATLQESKLIPALPDISGSLHELRKLLSKYPSPLKTDSNP
jgi:uroporphyrin-3 C-methyltransferase